MRHIYNTYNMFVLIVFACPLISIFYEPNELWYFQIVYCLVYLICGMSLLAHIKLNDFLTLESIFIILLIIFSFISCAWSEYPLLTIIRSGALLGTTIVGIYFAKTMKGVNFIYLLGNVLIVLILGSVILSTLAPQYGYLQNFGAYNGWNGLWGHRNTLGKYAALTIIVLYFKTYNLKRKAVHIVFHIIMLMMTIIVLIKTNSLTSLVTVITVILVFELSKILKMSLVVRLFGIIAFNLILTITLIYFFNNYEYIFRTIGKDVTLTGRTLLWDASIYMWLQKPLFGYGYAGFWISPFGPSFMIQLLGGFDAIHAHNGYINILLELGIIGLILSATVLIKMLIKTHSNTRIEVGTEKGFYAGFFVFFLLNNITEVSIMYRNNLLWLIFITITFMVNQLLSRRN